MIFSTANGQTVLLSNVPPAVQKIIRAQTRGGTLGDIFKTTGDGETTYDVGLTAADGTDRDFSVAEDGILLSVEVTLAETPDPVRKAVKAQATGWELESIDKNVDDAEISYDIEVTKDGREKGFTIGEDGSLWSVEMELSETPAPVQKTIRTETGGNRIESIEKTLEDDVTYDIEVTNKNGREQGFAVAPDGRLLSRQVSLPEVPLPARKAIKEHLAGGTILRIDKSFAPEKGVPAFEVEGRKDGKPFDFGVGPHGKFLGMDD